MAKLSKTGRAAHRKPNPARDLLYKYADLQREIDLQVGELETMTAAPSCLRYDALMERIKQRLEAGIIEERRLRTKVDAMLDGIERPHFRETLTRRYIDGDDWPDIVDAIKPASNRESPYSSGTLHMVALKAANRSLNQLERWWDDD